MKNSIDYHALPVQISLPYTKLNASKTYFKKLHLISDVLLGALRLYGHALIKIAEAKNNVPDELHAYYRY
jgi:hypothetical protein